jgi:transcriptional regulator with XRE-family HTH domain
MISELKRFRRLSKLAQKELGKLAGVSQSTIAQIETGKIDPSVRTLEKLATALGIEIAEFFASEKTQVINISNKRKTASTLTAEEYTSLGKTIAYAKAIGFLR